MVQKTLAKLCLGLLIASFVSVAMLIAGEIAMRAAGPFDLRYIRAMREPDPRFGWRLSAGERFLVRMPEANVLVSYNSDGWRDIEPRLRVPAYDKRVLVLGDSFMEAYSVNLEEAFHRRLIELARDDDVELDVYNLAVAGYGTLQSLITYREYGRELSPDIVLLGFFVGNDVHNNSLELGASVHTGLQKLLSRPFLDPRTGEIVQVDYARAESIYRQTKSAIGVYDWGIARRSLLAREVAREVNRIRRRLTGPHDEPDGSFPRELEEVRKPMSRYEVHACDEKPELARAWDLTNRLLKMLRDEVRRDGGRLIVITVPALEEVDADEARRIEADDADITRLCLEETPGHAKLLRSLDVLGIDHVHLLPVFRSEAAAGKSLFRRSDRHWNPAGHRLAARTVYTTALRSTLR